MTGRTGLSCSDPVNGSMPINGKPDAVTPISYTRRIDGSGVVADGLRCTGFARVDGRSLDPRHQRTRCHHGVRGPQTHVSPAMYPRRVPLGKTA